MAARVLASVYQRFVGDASSAMSSVTNVRVPPNEVLVPLMVMLLLVNEALPMLERVVSAPLMVLLVSVCEPVNVATVLSIDTVTLAVSVPDPDTVMPDPAVTVAT